MILGAAATVLGLLGFRVRCVCYSEYLSNRDFNQFEDVFDYFQLTSQIKYSKIAAYHEDTIAAKGNLRDLTGRLVRDTSSDVSSRSTQNTRRQRSGISSTTSLRPAVEEILLVDEVDVFFGSDFYGQTYNQAYKLHEPEIEKILKEVWKINNQENGRRQLIRDIKAMPAYSSLVRKYPNYVFLIDNEIAQMLAHVRHMDSLEYYLSPDRKIIGYKDMDTISYDTTYGYLTAFAYLEEDAKGRLKDAAKILANNLVMSISCGQFSYANITPVRILGVSGTLTGLSEYEKKIMARYGIESYLYVPSVYGESNFNFDKAGDEIYLEQNTSDHFHRITDSIITASSSNRAVIVFFADNSKLAEYTSSAFYRKLGRNKKLLTEDMSAADKEFVISKAATAGQITISSAMFGRGTDFYCKDDRVQDNGGVLVIQAFLSAEVSEEIQIQGRTARQGKKGSFQMVLLGSDLEKDFAVEKGAMHEIERKDRYGWLCDIRNKARSQHCEKIEKSLVDATAKDQATHKFFDALLAGRIQSAREQFKDLYNLFRGIAL